MTDKMRARIARDEAIIAEYKKKMKGWEIHRNVVAELAERYGMSRGNIYTILKGWGVLKDGGI